MNSLRAKLSTISSRGPAPAAPSGFQLLTPEMIHFFNAAGFMTAIKEQAEAIAVVGAADYLDRIDADGRIEGTEWRLSKAAFADLCSFAAIPVSFINMLVKFDEQQALDVVETCLANRFHVGNEKSLVIDSRSGRVEGIVGSETYSPITHVDAVNYTLSASADLQISNGWLMGTEMRLTAVSEKLVEAKPGDPVAFGINLENSLNGDRALSISDYIERRVHKNGFTATGDHNTTHIIHRGDPKWDTQKAIVLASHRAGEILPLIKAAAQALMSEQDLGSFEGFVINPKHGGTDALWAKVASYAKQEAADDGRTDEQVTLWNCVNGISMAGQDSTSIARRTQVEAMGYKALVKYGAVLL